jgi:hypothetical protein
MVISAPGTVGSGLTETLSIGVTTGSVVLSFVFVCILIAKEVSVTYPSVDEKVVDSLNALLVPLGFGFVVVVLSQSLL